MRIHFAVLALLSASVAACSHPGSTEDLVRFDNFGSFNGAKVELSADGGIAALSIKHAVTHDDRAFSYTMGHICGTTCQPALDSASGSLSAAAADSLFNIVLGQDVPSLKDDYGTTRGGADMMTYTLKVTAEGKVKTVVADDGTMPAPMRVIVQAVTGIVAAARR